MLEDNYVKFLFITLILLKKCMGIYTQHACVAFELGKRMEN